MKKIFLIVISVILSLCFFTLAGCGGGGDITVDPDGNITGNAKVKFWCWGEEAELNVFNKLVNDFNAANPNITVELSDRGVGYVNSTYTALSGRGGPDVVYVGDSELKSWVYDELLLPLDDYLEKSTKIDPTDIWDSAMQRYRYDVATAQSRPTDPIYAMPKDIGPSVIYYNADALGQVGIEIISSFSEDMAAFNETKGGVAYPTDSGFFLIENGVVGKITSIPNTDADRKALVNRMKNASKRIFNNRIPMTWEESVAMSMLNTQSYNADSKTLYGYFTEWWFNYGWSVGGDCIKLNENDEWVFSLGDKAKVGTNTASQFDAFAHFISLSQSADMSVADGINGLAVTPTPSAIKSTGKTGYFTSQKIAMLVDLRFTTATYRTTIDKLADSNPNKFHWDVAPLPKHKDGVEAGHSGSVGLGINAQSKVPTAAWKFIEFISGEDGQKAQSETGFNIPNQKSLANSEVFLQPDKNPKNSEVFIKAAEVQRAGDWTYMLDRMWIEEWAPDLNSDVRNGDMTLDEFFAKVTAPTNEYLKTYIVGSN